MINFFSTNVLPGGKCDVYLWVFELQTFHSKQFYKMKKKFFNIFKTMAANMNEHETSVCFGDM